jgi:hypothetical protein
MPRVGFEHKSPAFEREKTVYALDCGRQLVTIDVKYIHKCGLYLTGWRYCIVADFCEHDDELLEFYKRHIFYWLASKFLEEGFPRSESIYDKCDVQLQMLRLWSAFKCIRRRCRAPYLRVSPPRVTRMNSNALRNCSASREPHTNSVTATQNKQRTRGGVFIRYRQLSLYSSIWYHPFIYIHMYILFVSVRKNAVFMRCVPLSAILCKLAHEQEQRDTSAIGKSKN